MKLTIGRVESASVLRDVAAIENACFGAHAYPLDLFRRYYRRSNVIFLVARRGGALAGYTVGSVDRRFRPKAARLDSLAVSPVHRGCRIGAALLSAFQKAAAACGCALVRLQVAEDNYFARGLYESSGYEVTAMLPDYYGPGRDGIEMTYELRGRAAD